MVTKLSQVLNGVLARLNPRDDEPELTYSSCQAVLEAVEEAKQEWLNARIYFDNVVDPDLIDLAIYTMDAAERKYMYLLKQAKSMVNGANGMTEPAVTWPEA